jgi:uncharacterized damage-inducible protein DinB
MRDKRLEEALRHLHPPPRFDPWHGGPTVLGALRGVSAEVAAWKPYPDRHSIWALALHVAYWNHAVERRLTGGKRGSFPRRPSNWPRPLPGDPERAWIEDLALTRRYHDSLVETLRGVDTARLDDPAGGKRRTTWADLITGVLLHDTYHAGQIQMLKRLARSHGLGGTG